MNGCCCWSASRHPAGPRRCLRDPRRSTCTRAVTRSNRRPGRRRRGRRRLPHHHMGARRGRPRSGGLRRAGRARPRRAHRRGRAAVVPVSSRSRSQRGEDQPLRRSRLGRATMNAGRMILGGLLLLIGAVWMLQGVGLVGGSFMTGQSLWTVIGAVVAVVGGRAARMDLAAPQRGRCRKPCGGPVGAPLAAWWVASRACSECRSGPTTATGAMIAGIIGTPIATIGKVAVHHAAAGWIRLLDTRGRCQEDEGAS